MGRQLAGQFFQMNRSPADAQIADRCLAIASSLQDAATEVARAVRWTNFDRSVVSLAECYGIVRYDPPAFAGTGRAIKAFSHLAERILKPRLGPVLARKVGRESLAQVVTNYEAINGRN